MYVCRLLWNKRPLETTYPRRLSEIINHLPDIDQLQTISEYWSAHKTYQHNSKHLVGERGTKEVETYNLSISLFHIESCLPMFCSHFKL